MNGFHSLPEFELDNNKNLKISLLFIPTFAVYYWGAFMN